MAASFDSANFMTTIGTSVTYPAYFSSGVEAATGIPAGSSFPTTPGNPNGQTTVQADSKAAWDPATQRQRPVKVHAIHSIVAASHILTMSDHNGNQVQTFDMATRGSFEFRPPLEWNKGFRASANAGQSLIIYTLGNEVRR